MRPVVAVTGTYPRVFREWGISVTLVKGDDGAVYFPVRQLCRELGLDVDAQLARLRSDPEIAPGVVEMRLALAAAGGMQATVCLRKRHAAWWLAHIDDRRVSRPEIAADLRRVRQRLIDAAEALIFADITQAPERERGVIAVSSRDVLVLACPECGTRWRVTVVNGEATIEPETAERDSEQ